MLLSIIIPTYNAEKYIGRCLDSIIAQEMDAQDYEVLLVNDGSTDRTLEIAESYTEKMPLRIISQLNAGVSAARNNGMEHSLGDWLEFVDSDDALIPKRLPRVLKYVNRGGKL